jgi:hypothetical protein
VIDGDGGRRLGCEWGSLGVLGSMFSVRGCGIVGRRAGA